MFIKINFERIHYLNIILLLVTFWAFYHSILQTWWLADDPVYLQAVAEYGILAHFYQPEIWQRISQANFTPWLVLSLGIDYQLFSLTPFYAYLHHLLVFSLVLIAFYWLLNRFFHPVVVAFIILLFIFSTPISYLAQHLMVRHYVEGLGFALLAVIFYLQAVQTGKMKWAMIGSFFYLLAALAKELYVPLVVILPCFAISIRQTVIHHASKINVVRLFWEKWKPHINMWLPFIFAAAIYTAWRLYMLKTSHVMAGYDNSLVPPLSWEVIKVLPQQIIQFFNWQSTWQLVTIFITILLFLVIYIKKYHLLCKSCIFLWLIIAILLIIPVASILTPRYLLLVYLLLIFSFAVVLQFFITKHHFYLAAILSLLLLITQLMTVIHQDFATSRAKIEGEFALYHNTSNAILLNPQNPFWYFQSLQWLRQHVLNLPPKVNICYDGCICTSKNQAQRYQYENTQLVIKSAQVEQCGKDQPFAINLKFENRLLSWQLQPYQTGQYYGAIGIDEQVTGHFFTIPAQGSYSVRFDETLSVVFKHIASDNHVTYSEVLTLNKSQDTLQLNWQR